MPQPITSSTNAYALLHELNKSQLNIGEVQISGLCSRCSALGTLLTQEIVRPQSPIKKNKAKELSKQLNEISTAVNKHLVQQLPLIKKQMQQSLNAMMSVEGPHQTSAGKSQNSTYIKTIDLLQENIVQITQRLNGAMERVLEVIPLAKQNELGKLFQALTIYQTTLCQTSLISTESSRLNIFLDCLKSNVEMYLSGVSDGPERIKLLEFSSMVDKLTEDNKTVFESFKMQTINNLPIMNVFDSANQKLQKLGQQLTVGDLSNSDIVLALAKRHQTESVTQPGLLQLQLIQADHDTLSEEVISYLQNIQLEDINSLADELIEAEQTEAPAETTISKKPQETGNPVAEKETKPAVTSGPSRRQSTHIAEKPLATKFNAELSKLADWLRHDVKKLAISTSDEKRKMGDVFAGELQEIDSRIDADRWPTGKAEVQQYKKDVEHRLNQLEQLIAEAMAHNSPPPSPQQSPKTSPQPEPHNSPNNDATTQIVAIKPTPKPATLDSQLRVAIQKLNTSRTKMFDAYSRQEAFRQILLENHIPHSIAWVNINQTDMVLDYISQNIAIQPHVLYIKPYVEKHLPIAEMIRAIQAERFHPHFDQRNCQAYLGHASNWLDTLTPHFDYLDQLISITESMLTNQQRVA